MFCVFATTKMSTVDAAIINYITNGGGSSGGGSEPIVSPKIELTKVHEFTGIDDVSLSGQGIFVYVDAGRLIHGDRLRFYKAGAQETFDGVIKDVRYMSNSTNALYDVQFEGDHRIYDMSHDAESHTIFIPDYTISETQLTVVVNDPKLGVFRLTSTDPMVSMLLDRITYVSDSLSDAQNKNNQLT